MTENNQEGEQVTMDNCTRLDKEVEACLANGMTVFPLPQGEKFPPPGGTTGNIPTLTSLENRSLWEGVSGSHNVGWRLPDNVICIDVDHYGEKTGGNTLEELEADLGTLPTTWSTTRRGADSLSRKHLYIVPAGYKWHAKAGKDIDVIQMSHRYVVVAPSAIKGLSEQWYYPDSSPSDVAPHMEDLATLPEPWINHLKKEPLNLKNAPAEDLDWSESDEWLSKVALTYCGELGPIFKSILEDEELFASNRHDTMVKKQEHFMRLAVLEGQNGLQKALEELERLFIDAVNDRAIEKIAKWEFESALYSGVNKIRGQIEAGKVTPFVSKAVPVSSKAVPVSLVNITSLMGAAEAKEAVVETMKTVGYLFTTEIGDNLPAALLQWWNDSLIVVRGRGTNGKGTSDLYDTADGRFADVSKLMTLCDELTPVLKAYRDGLSPEDDESSLKVVNSVLSYFATKRKVADMQDPLKGKLEVEGRVKDESEFDKDPWVLLLSDGLILDLRKANEPGAPLFERVRLRSRNDLLTPTRMMGISGADIKRYEGASTLIDDLYRIIFPDSAVREQVYRAQAYSLLGENSHRLLWGLIGEPGTGKGTATKAYTGVLGSYAVPTALSALMDTGGNNTKLAAALKARVATMSEFSPEGKGDVNMLKAISGDDTIQVADKYKAAEELRSGTTLFFETNHAPNLEADKAFRDRLMVVPMEGSREELEEWLSTHSEWNRNKANLVGHLETLIEHFHHAYSQGFKDSFLPSKMVQAADQFVADGDPLSEWIEDNFVFDSEYRLLTNSLGRKVQLAINKGELPKETTELKVRKCLEKAGAVYSRDNKITIDGERGRGLHGVQIGQPLRVLATVPDSEGQSA